MKWPSGGRGPRQGELDRQDVLPRLQRAVRLGDDRPLLAALLVTALDRLRNLARDVADLLPIRRRVVCNTPSSADSGQRFGALWSEARRRRCAPKTLIALGSVVLLGSRSQYRRCDGAKLRASASAPA